MRVGRTGTQVAQRSHAPPEQELTLQTALASQVTLPTTCTLKQVGGKARVSMCLVRTLGRTRTASVVLDLLVLFDGKQLDGLKAVRQLHALRHQS